MKSFTTIMYHYVRDVACTPYAALKVLNTSEFKGQLDYLGRHYNFIRIEDVIASVHDDQHQFPEKALLLTFDDGYLEHYQTVFPILRDRGIQGVFFPPVLPIVKRCVLDVNKIQFVLAKQPNLNALIRHIDTIIIENKETYNLKSPREYWDFYAKPTRYDSASIIYFKRMLQLALPYKLRTKIVAELFETHVSQDEKGFSERLYISADNLREMHNDGMFIGAHGESHRWMNTLSKPEQRREINASLNFLKTIGVSDQDWIMCYPYGGHNDDLIRLIKKYGCKLAFTVEAGISDLNTHHPLRLPRIDTNELPKSLVPGID